LQFELHCEGCPADNAKEAWQCNSCYYVHPDPVGDAFYQDQVKTLMYACAGILLFVSIEPLCRLSTKNQSYLIGLWFSLRTHAAQIWQNPQQLMKAEEHPAALPGLHPSLRNTLIQRSTPQSVLHNVLPTHKDRNDAPAVPGSPPTPTATAAQANNFRAQMGITPQSGAPSEECQGKLSGGNFNLPPGYTPFLESIDTSMKNQPHLTPMKLPEALTTEDFTRAVAVATVSALRHQGSIIQSQHGSIRRDKAPPQPSALKEEQVEEEGGGHEAPSWNRGTSAGVLLACTLLYAVIAGAYISSGMSEQTLTNRNSGRCC